MMKYERVLLEHGGGGLLSNELVGELFLPLLRNRFLEKLEDGAVLQLGDTKICFTTDSYVVQPVFFPGGNIGSLAVHGTVNDLAVSGGEPLFLSAGFILAEGFPMADLERIVHAMAEAAREAEVQIVTGDTKVVPQGAADGIYINTAGVGIIRYATPLSVTSIRPGDAILVNGTVGDHGAAIMASREELGLEADILSDSAPLSGLVRTILAASPEIHCMRDATRGGLGAILAEMALQAKVQITAAEDRIPFREETRGVCEILGLDPLFLANEGKLVVFCPEAEEAAVLAAMRNNPYGRDAAVIGYVEEAKRGRFILQTAIGGFREVDLPTGELVPRIC